MPKAGLLFLSLLLSRLFQRWHYRNSITNINFPKNRSLLIIKSL